jgi:aldose 1-epimerase
MSGIIEHFGNMPDGDTVSRISLSKDGLQAKIITYGASLQDLRLDSHDASLVLGFPEFTPYLDYPYFGPFVGRVANRIAEARFQIGEEVFQTDKNERNRQTLHGGAHGISSKNWQIVHCDQTSVTLKTTDLESETGFPGDCEISATYRSLSDQVLELEVTATSTKTTVCNIAHHSYFNLNGTGTILDHQMQIFSDHYLPVDENQIPTGEIKSLEGTPFDFRTLKIIEPQIAAELDHNFCLNAFDKKMHPAAHILSAKSGIQMEISTSETGLQVYAGKHLDTFATGTNGDNFSAYSGIALEPQAWPDAPNQPNFPSILLRAGQTYHQKSQFKFFKKTI